MTLQKDCPCGLREHIQKMIDKCKAKKKEIEDGECIVSIPEQQMEEERYEYLDNLQNKLQFMLDHTGMEQTV